MKKNIWFILFVACSFLLFAKDNHSIAVVNIERSEIAHAEEIIDTIRSSIEKSSTCDLVGKPVVDQTLDDLKIGAADLFNDANIVPFRRLCGADYVLLASLNQDENKIYLSLSLTDLDKGEIINSSANEVLLKDIENFHVEEITDDLIASIDERFYNKRPIVHDEFTSGIQFSLKPVLSIPLSPLNEIMDLGFGLNIDGDYRIIALGPGFITAGFTTGYTYQSTKDDYVLYPYSYTQIPMTIGMKYCVKLRNYYIYSRISAGGVLNVFSYKTVSPYSDQEEDLLSMNILINPNIGLVYQITEIFGVSASCDYNLIIYNDVLTSSLLIGLALDITF